MPPIAPGELDTWTRHPPVDSQPWSGAKPTSAESLTTRAGSQSISLHTSFT